MKMIDYAKMATGVWDEFTKECPGAIDKITKYFHLRPTNSGVTLITTLHGYEMRGRKNITNPENLKKLLLDINGYYDAITSVDGKGVRKVMDRLLHFPRRDKSNDRKLEEKVQATMINTMSKDENLKNALGAAKPIKFICSELIFEKGPYRVDIIGYDGSDIYLFELKKARTTEVHQVSDYVSYYGKKRRILEEILRNYPVNSVRSFDGIKGVMVMEYAESSVNRRIWKDLAREHGINILFYRHSLSYQVAA